MALTGILLRRDDKENLKLEPPIEGEIVFAKDTNEYGAKVGNELIWKAIFSGPAVRKVLTLDDLANLADIRTNDFCFVQGTNKLYNFFGSKWNEITEVDDLRVVNSKTWSSEKIASYKIDGNTRKVSLKNSDIPGIPFDLNLDDGEFFVNVADAKIFFKKKNLTAGTSSLIELTDSQNIFFNNTYFNSQLNQTILSGLNSLNTRDAIYELSSLKAPKLNAQLTTPDIGVATGISFNGITALSSSNPFMNNNVAIGLSTTAARADHVHPIDTSRAPIESPTFNTFAKAPYFWSTANTGTVPIVVSSTTLVNNLNVGLFNSQNSAYYRNSSNINAGILSAEFGGTGTAGTLTGIPFQNAKNAYTVATSAQILTQVQNSKTGTGVFALNNSPTFTTSIITPKITNDSWCLNSFNATSTSLSNISIQLGSSSELSGGELQIVVSEGSGENLKRNYTKVVYLIVGLNVYINEESQIFSDTALATFDITIIDGSITLICTPLSINVKTYKIKSSSIKN
jgi:hypothetical protein